MSKALQSLQRVTNLSRCPHSNLQTTRATSTRDHSRFQAGDRFLLNKTKLSNPLTQDGQQGVDVGSIAYKDIIGRNVSMPFFVRAERGRLYRIEQPSLAQYIALTPRVVTPIYSSYAESIISLLDIHAPPFYEGEDSKTPTTPSIEILDAGTGHGALTLHISRAIASANPPPLNLQIPTRSKILETQSLDPTEHDESHQTAHSWTEWKQSRRAVVHSVEEKFSTGRHAEKVVAGFRQGLYWPHVDFHNAQVGEWVGSQLVQRQGKSFLSYVFLDLPNVHDRLKDCFAAMRDGAKALIFVPSITQVCECVKMIKDQDLALSVDTVVELGEGISSGRKWDVRIVTTRRPQTPPTSRPGDIPAEEEHDAESLQDTDKVVLKVPSTESTPDVEPTSDGEREAPTEAESRNISSPETTPTAYSPIDSSPATSPKQPQSSSSAHQDDRVVICRPKVGEVTVGGGFVAVFHKMSPEEWALQSEWKRTRTGAAKKFYRSQ